jgi:hypothetical protein
VRRQDSHVFYTIGSQMALRLSALRAGRPLPQGRFLVLISARGRVEPRAIVRLEGLGQLKKKIQRSYREPNPRLPDCSIVPQTTALPRASGSYGRRPLINSLIRREERDQGLHTSTLKVHGVLLLDIQ